jgi:hypothetical protein
MGRGGSPDPTGTGDDAAIAGQRLWFLEIPFRTPAPGARWDRSRKAWVYSGAELPADLTPYRPHPYSRLQWLEDEANSMPAPRPASVAPKTPRPIQISGAAAIAAAYIDGWRQFLLCDDVGTGKTITLWLGALAVAAARRRSVAGTPGGRKTGEPCRILVLVDRPAAITIPHWRNTIAALGDGGHRVLISSPDQLPKLLARNGRPAIRWDIVIADECHLYRHVTARRTAVFRRVARFEDPHATAPFVVAASATPGQHPAELTYLAPVIAQLRGEKTTAWSDFGTKLALAGLPIEKNRFGKWGWDSRAADDPDMQQDAIGQVRGWLADNDPPLTLYRAAPWGPAPLDLMPVELAAEEMAVYRTLWKTFQRALAALAAGSAVAGGMPSSARPTKTAATRQGRAAVLRFRQKASLLRVPATVEWIRHQVDSGYQVAVSCEFLGAAALPIGQALSSVGIPVARIHGSVDGEVRDLERERMRFQSGSSRVVVFTPSASLSLHANEHLADGTRSTTASRVGLMHNVRYSGLAGRQILGRTHRDHQVSPWWVSYAENTVEEGIAQIMIERFKATADTAGADASALGQVAEQLGVAWLSADVLIGDQ